MADDIVIRAEGLGKKYLIGHQSAKRATSLRDAIAEGFGNYARTAGEMLHGKPIIYGDEVEEFWALRGVGFEIRRGDVVGIIGRNGAGKSTLLKILSRITEPSEGRVELTGRVASLLEVGTGFHPELTGRENIFLNAAILGMTRAEVRRKFDEIIDFSGVEKFLDTPVKRYSSGMYVRLAFAVAAHLEPEILIVDEVLAVGDAEFQKKCLGKMHDVAENGRTVLFVSHNITAIQTLCKQGFYMKDGSLQQWASINEAVRGYTAELLQGGHPDDLGTMKSTGRKKVRFKMLEFVDERGVIVSGPVTGQPIVIRMHFSEGAEPPRPSRLGVGFVALAGSDLFLCSNECALAEPLLVGSSNVVSCRIPRFPLTGGTYGMTLFLERDGVIEHWIQEPVSVTVHDAPFFGTYRNAPAGHEGQYVLVPNDWLIEPC